MTSASRSLRLDSGREGVKQVVLMESSRLTIFYIPVPSRETGLALCRDMVEASLAACGNLLGPMTSVYEWEGELREEAEWVLLLKTTPEKAAALQDRMNQAHPYDCPCVLSWPVGANPAFAAWVGEQVS